MDLVGTLTAELFLLPDGSLVVNELAPRVHNSGHWTIEGAATSQFEQHVRAICGLGLGSTDALAPTAMVNLLGTGPRRTRACSGIDDALVDPTVHLHLYDKRRVFERRKMGHLTALGPTSRRPWRGPARRARALRWAGPMHGGRRDDRAASAAAPLVGVVGGSRSDFPTLEAAVAVLDELGVAVGAAGRLGPPHARPPVPLRRGGAPVAGSGSSSPAPAARPTCPGMLAAKTILPVIGVPIPTQHLGGLDSLLSIVQMPRGIPVATVAIGNATNAGLLAAAILAVGDPALAERLAAWRARQTEGRPRRPVERRGLRAAPRGATALAGREVHLAARAGGARRRWKPRSSAILSTTRTTRAATGAPVIEIAIAPTMIVTCRTTSRP